MLPAVNSIPILKIRNGDTTSDQDLVVVEEPLAITLEWGNDNDRKHQNIAVTMRTPGHDFELALGFLFTEGIINDYQAVTGIRYCSDGGRNETPDNTVRVSLAPDTNPDIAKLQRNFYTSSSCGVCGKSSIESIKTICSLPTIATENSITVDATVINSLASVLHQNQTVFKYTGGIHAAGLFNLNGELILLREDVGRHNAMDKLVGASLVSGFLPLNSHVLFLSGRASFELIQKAAMAGIRIIAAVGAPSSLAVNTAKEFDITLLGFVREQRFNVYCGGERITS